MIRLVLPLLVLAAFAVLAVVLYMIVRRFNQAMVVRRAQDALDLKLHEWQLTASLEDLERHRRRLECQLDDMHGSWREEVPETGAVPLTPPRAIRRPMDE